MLSGAQEQCLVDLCNQFINSGDDIGLPQLLGLVDSTIPDKESQEWKVWTKHMDTLNEAWMRINKEGEKIPWPTPPTTTLQAASNLKTTKKLKPAHQGLHKVYVTHGDDNFEYVAEKDVGTRVEAISLERKSQADGAKGVGPARQETLISQANKPGKRRDTLVDELVVQVDEPTNDEDKMHRVVYCVACIKKVAGRDPKRIKQHAEKCNALAKNFPSLYAQAVKDLAGKAHSTKLGKVKAALDASHGLVKDSVPLTEYMGPSKLSKDQIMKIEWTMFRMFICCALPWALLDSQWFIAFVETLSPAFKVPDRSSFFPKHLAQEVSAWSEGFKDFIKSYEHLTLSFDGWSTRSRDELYTFHTTTPKRRSFFTDGHVFRGESVTGDALLGVISKILATYDARKYSAIAGDGGPNVRSAKIKVHALYPWIINIYDPCHNLNLFMKDVGKLFKDILSVVAGIAAYFGKSNYGTYHLDEERKKRGISVGIKSLTETRFSSSYYQVESVNSCIYSIQICIGNGKLPFDTAATKKLREYIEEGPKHYRMRVEMTSFLRLLSGAANGLLTLEGQNTNCADIFYVWVCIAYQLESALSNPSFDLERYRSSVTLAYNHRFQQMMKESSHRIFLLAYYLHPLYRHHGCLQLVLPPTMPTLVDGQAPDMAGFPELFCTLMVSVLEIFQGEQCRTQESGEEAVPELMKEFILYAYNEKPFSDQVWSRNTNPLKWWKRVAGDSKAHLLGGVAMKIFSISPSEICDERTASRLGWFNASRRSSMLPEHLVGSAKLYDLYVNGFDDSSKSTHRARVHLPKAPANTTSEPTVRSAPTLLDLINTEHLDPKDVDSAALEEELFNQPDPYDLDETDSNRVDPALQERVIRSSTRLDMAKYVKLGDPTLKVLIENVDSLGPGTSLAQPAAKSAQPIGKPGQWDVASFMKRK